MASFFNCAAYDDVDTTIRLNDHVVFLASVLLLILLTVKFLNRL